MTRRTRVLLVASTGGHLAELHRLAPRLGVDRADVRWVTNDTPQARELLADERVTHVPYLGSRNPVGLASMLGRARRILTDASPDVVVSTGSGIALAFLPLARTLGARTHYIESATRIHRPSVTGRALERVPGVHCYTQHPGASDRRWRYAGSVLDDFEVVSTAPPRGPWRVVVTLGTWRQPFRAMIEQLLRVLPHDAQVLWQTGHTDVADLPIDARPWVGTDELRDALQQADLVVSHAGMGATLDALDAGRLPVLLPRRAAAGEQVDDHQVELADELAQRGLAITRLPELLTRSDLDLATASQVVTHPSQPLTLSTDRPRRRGGATTGPDRRPALLVASHAGQATVADLRADAAAGRRPTKDYVALADATRAVVVDSHHVERWGGPFTRLLARRVDLAAAQALLTWRDRRRFSDLMTHTDKAGLLLAALCRLTGRRTSLGMITAWPTAGRKPWLFRWLHVDRSVRSMVFYSSVQLERTHRDLGVPREKLHLALQPVDLDFWRSTRTGDERLVCAVGWESRDYGTLLRAVADLDVQTHLALGTIVFTDAEVRRAHGAANEPDGGEAPTPLRGFESLRGTAGYRSLERWIDEAGRDSWPADVVLHRQVPPLELRSLYERARVVVVPLHEVDTDAGVNVIAEAMAMSRPVVVSATRGQVDLVRHGETGLYVPPGDADAMRSAIGRLLDDPDLAARLGRAGRRHAERHLGLDDYVTRVAAVLGHPRAATPTDATGPATVLPSAGPSRARAG